MKFAEPLGIGHWFVFEIVSQTCRSYDFDRRLRHSLPEDDTFRSLFERLTLSNVTLTLNVKLRK